MAKQTLVRQLQNRIERIETSARADDGQVISSGNVAVDKLLPDGGYRRGTLIEWVSVAAKNVLTTGSRSCRSKNGRFSGGCGADYLSLLTAANACSDGGALVIADRHRQFNPPAAAAIGVDLGNVVVIRPPEEKSVHDRRYDEEFFWAIDQALGCSAVAVVWGAIETMGERWYRRFQLSAEASGTMGLFVRSGSAMDQPTWAEVRWSVAAMCSGVTAAATQQVEVTLARCRGGRAGQKIELSIDTVSGEIKPVTAFHEGQPIVAGKGEARGDSFSVQTGLSSPMVYARGVS